MTNYYKDKSNNVRNKNELKRIEKALRKSGQQIEPLDVRIRNGELIEVTQGFDGEWVDINHFSSLMEFRRPGSTKSNR